MTSKECFLKGTEFLFEYNKTSSEEYLQLALDSFNKAIDLNPDYAEAFHKRALVYGFLDEYEAKFQDLVYAIRIFRSKISEDETNPELHYKIALAYKDNYNENDHLVEARNHFNKTLKYGYGNSDIFFEIAETYTQSPDINLEIALKYYDKAIEVDPNISDYYLARGECYDLLKNYDCALKDFSMGVELNPNDWRSYNSRGELYLQMQEWGKATSDYIRFRRLYPNIHLPEIKLFKNTVGGPFFELYFAEDLSAHTFWHPDSTYIEDCIFAAFDRAFAFTKQNFGYYGIFEYNNDELKSVLAELKFNLSKLDSINNYQKYFEYMVSCKFIYTLVRDFDDYETKWETILKDLKRVNNQLINLISEALNKNQKMFLFGI